MQVNAEDLNINRINLEADLFAAFSVMQEEIENIINSSKTPEEAEKKILSLFEETEE